MAPRLGMRGRLPLPPHSEHSTSPGSVGSYSVATRSTTRSPYPSGHDLPGLVAAQPQAAVPYIEEILDIWETTWFGTPCSSLTSHTSVPKWFPPLHHDPEQVDVPDALAVAGHQNGMAYNPAPIILQHQGQQQQQHPQGLYASYYDHAVAGQQPSGLSPTRQTLQQQQQQAAGSGHPSPTRPPPSPHHSTAAGAHASFATGYLNSLAAMTGGAAAADAGGQWATGGLLANGAPPAVGGALPSPDQEDIEQTSFSQVLQELAQQQQQQEGGALQPRLSNASSGGGCDSPFTLTLGTWTKRQYLLLPMPPSPATQRQQEQEQQQEEQEVESRRHSGMQGDATRQNRTSPEAASAQPIPGSFVNGGTGLSNGAHYGNGTTAAAATAHRGARAAAAAGAAGGGSKQQGGGIPEEECTFDEDAVAAAAWRFRMARRWQTEQQRAPDPAHSASDGADEALQYMHACGVNWNLARTGSTDPQLAGTGDGVRCGLATMGTLDGSFLGLELLASEDGLSSSRAGSHGLLARAGLSREASFQGTIGGPRGSAQGVTALQEVAKISKRAAELAAAQGAIEAQVNQRWEQVQGVSSHGEAWVGGLLQGVMVDDWGEFAFILVRVRGRGGRQRMLVRGSNYSSRAQLVEALTRQMMQRCAAEGVQPEPLEVVGGGIMEWRRDRDRHLFIRQGYADLAAGMSGKEVMNLTAVLTKQSLSLGYKVSVDGGRDF